MFKSFVFWGGVILIGTSTAFAGVTEDFSSFEKSDNPPKSWKVRGAECKFIKESDNTLLELSAVEDEVVSSVKIPLEFDNRNITGQFDWKCDTFNNGDILKLSDWSHKKIVFGLRLQGTAIFSTSFTKKGRIERLKLHEIKRGAWYRISFSIKENDLTYVIKIVKRNEDNTADIAVGYDSSEDWDEYYIHKTNPANMLFMAITGKKKVSSYFYDNIDINNK